MKNVIIFERPEEVPVDLFFNYECTFLKKPVLHGEIPVGFVWIPRKGWCGLYQRDISDEELKRFIAGIAARFHKEV